MLYDNDAIYISAKLYDDESNKIQKEVTYREILGVDDYFSVSINGFNDSQQDFRFFVTTRLRPSIIMNLKKLIATFISQKEFLT